MIFDTNVLIYVGSISIITNIEALGFSFKGSGEHQLLADICNQLIIYPLSAKIAEETIGRRKKFRIKLPDAIIYTTALVDGSPLSTNNINDFKTLDGKVERINPFTL